MQDVRLAAEAEADGARHDLTTAAFIGWQVAGSFGGSKIGPFDKYLKNLGLAPKRVGPRDARAPEDIARQAVERARSAWKGR